MTDQRDLVEYARSILQEESAAILRLADRIDDGFIAAVDLMFECRGRVVVTGIGKSGHIARKFASTLASTGTPAFFVNPAECLHGDFGMIAQNDVLVLLSKSGEAREIAVIIPYIKRSGVQSIAICNERESHLAVNVDVLLETYVEKEACPLNLAPTTSSTVTLALCDSLAVALMGKRSFTERDFALLHPAGSLGKQLAEIRCIMRSGEEMPIVGPDQTYRDALLAMVDKELGTAVVVDERSGKLLGTIVDEDLRRLLAEEGEGILDRRVEALMTRNPRTVGPDALAGEALSLMEGRLATLVVVENGIPLGLIHVHDILGSRAT